MKTIYYLLFIWIGIGLISCQKETETALFAVPVVKKLTDIRSEVRLESAHQTHSDGKIYVAQNLLFYIAQENGVHIFDNTNPVSPTNLSFINIPGVHDIAVKGTYLFADNYVDLLVFDISNIENITLVRTVENTFNFYPIYPEEAEYFAYDDYPNSDEILIGYQLERRAKPSDLYYTTWNDMAIGAEMANFTGNVGVGGSYAQFQIHNNALYKVDKYQLNVYNIGNPLQTYFDKNIYMNLWMNGGEFETLFKQKDFLFVGSTTGMFVINAQDEFNPYFVSGFSHATACDPVVVQGETAYITVRGGNTCGAIQDQINVLNISNIQNPTLISTTLLQQPYGLGIRGNSLYICTGTNGLKVFDATASNNLVLKNTYTMNVTDVIPLESHLLLVGPNKVIQMNYGSNFTLTPISVLNF